MDALETVRTEEQTEAFENTEKTAKKSAETVEKTENTVNEIETVEKKEEKILPAVRNLYGAKVSEPISYSVNTQVKAIKTSDLGTPQPEFTERREAYAEKPDSSTPFGKETADKASVIFGQSEAEMRREFKAFKAAKLFRKFDCDLTDVFNPEELDQKLIEAKNFGFGAVVVTPQKIRIAKTKLKGTGVEVVAAVCFPFGEECFGVKKYAVKKAIEKGADRVYVPVGVSAIKFGATDLIRREFKKIIKVAKKKKVSAVLENGIISSVETEKAVRALNGAGVMSFVSSSGKLSEDEGVSSVKNIRYFLRSGSEICGFTPSRKSEEAVGLMSVADRLFVKNAAELASDIRANLKY